MAPVAPPRVRIAAWEGDMTSEPAAVAIRAAETAADLSVARLLFQAYAESLDFSLDFQGFEDELDNLPGRYAPAQNGALLLGLVDGRPLGVVGLRDLGVNEKGERVCEMKRLYIDPEGRGRNLGRRLADAVINEARRLGYRVMRLDTLPRMVAANRIYDALGFRDIPPYYRNPLPDARYRELDL
jgi:ribosomal protein S18 acetylase RimI-like enzyme